MALIDFGGVTEEVITRKEFPMTKARKVLKKEVIAVIGYGQDTVVKSAFNGPLTGKDLIPISELANNPVRIETNGEAGEIDRRLRALWGRHPRFLLVPHDPSFFKKITFGLAAIQSLVAQLAG